MELSSRPTHIDKDKSPAFSFYSDMFFFKPNTLNLMHFTYYNNIVNSELAEDSYENFKALSGLFLPTLKGLSITRNNFTPTVSYASNLNLFRADFEESNWVLNTDYGLSEKNAFLTSTPNYMTNPLKLRTTIKNLMVTHSAIQKVYRSRFDEGRSNMNPHLLSSAYLYYPLLTENRSNYESALGKNKESFFTTSFFNKVSNDKYSNFVQIMNANNFILFDIPFLVSMKSDAARYL
jgi:hypothetical protein